MHRTLVLGLDQATSDRTSEELSLAAGGELSDAGRRALFGRELDFHDFVGWAGSRFPFPAANRVHRSRRQYGMSAFDLGGFHCAIRRHKRIQLDNALQ